MPLKIKSSLEDIESWGNEVKLNSEIVYADVVCNRCGHGDELSMTHKEWAKHVQKKLSYKWRLLR